MNNLYIIEKRNKGIKTVDDIIRAYGKSKHVQGEFVHTPEVETTFDGCPNKCGKLLSKWTEGNGDSYKTVWYCENCEKRIET